MTAGETHQAIEAIFRIERAKLIASLGITVTVHLIQKKFNALSP